MNLSKKPVAIYAGEGVVVSEHEHQDYTEYHLHVDESTIKAVCEIALLGYATENEELKYRISELEARLERVEFKL